MRNEKINAEFGRRFTEIVEKSGFKSTELVKLAEISKNSISEFKKGHVPTAETLCKLSQLLGTTCEYLLIGKEQENLTNEEQKLINTFRGCNPTGQQDIQDYAELIQNKKPKTERGKNSISTSAVG